MTMKMFSILINVVNNSLPNRELQDRGTSSVPCSDTVEVKAERKGKGWKKKKSMESRVRAIVERMYNAPFPSCRPSWLKSVKTKQNLELDMYNEKLKLAFEYNGRQHKEHIAAWMSKEAFEEQQWRDREKMMICKGRGIRLVCIPHTVLPEDIEAYIRKEVLMQVMTQ